MDFRLVAPLFLLSLTAGYFFSRDFEKTKWRIARSEGQRLLFESAIWGVFLTLLAWPLIFIFECINQWMATCPHCNLGIGVLPAYAPFLGAFLLGIILPRLLNNYFFKVKELIDRIIEEHGNALEKILYRASDYQHPVAIHLKNGKVYIGWPVGTPQTIKLNQQFIRLLPILSGYRKKISHKLEIVTQYATAYERVEKKSENFEDLSAADFVIVIRTDEILTANFYAVNIDQKLFDANEKPDPVDPKEIEYSEKGQKEEEQDQK